MKHLVLVIYGLLFLMSCNNNAKNGSNAGATDSAKTTANEQGSTNPHSWIGTETVKSRLGNFDFKNGYPTDSAVKKLSDALVYSRAVEAYLDQMHAVSWYNVWKGITTAGSATANQMVIWKH